MGREALSQSHAGALKGCPGCVELSELRHRVDSVAYRVDEAENMTEAISGRVSQVELAAARMGGVLDQIPGLIDAKFDALIQVLKTRDSVMAATARGKDPRESTPTSKLPELKAGPVALRGPVWLVLAVVIVLALVLGGLAAGAYVAAQWGPPARAASK